MALSSGTLALVLGAVGVGGYVVYRKVKEAQKAGACESLLQTAAKLVGYDLLPNMTDGSAATAICQVVGNAPAVGQAVESGMGFLSDLLPGGASKECPGDSYPDCSRIVDHRGGGTGCPCVDRKTGQVIGIATDAGFHPAWQETTTVVPPPVVPIATPLVVTTIVNADGSTTKVRRGGGGGVSVTPS